jgi:hypothetical protein
MFIHHRKNVNEGDEPKQQIRTRKHRIASSTEILTGNDDS